MNAFLNSYAQVFFSDHRWLAWLLVFVSFFDPWAGIAGALSVLVANSAAYWMGYNRWFIEKGFYGYNALLVGLGFGLTFQPGVAFYLLVVVSALLTLFFTIGIQGFLYKYALPYLSIPFLLGIWLIMKASAEFSLLGLSIRGIYINNELYALGGLPLIEWFQWFDALITGQALRTYLFSLGAIFFQYNLLAGFVIALGLLMYSRIAFSLSIIGFALAWMFYRLTGADLTALGYSYIGFNYILTSIALGGFFIIPSYKSYLWLILLLPMVIVITLGMQSYFISLGLGMYALPFNLLVLTFLYILKIRENPGTSLRETPIQLFSPEKNVYQERSNSTRFLNPESIPVGLPVLGEWTISQAYHGEHTHKGEWAHALDLIVYGQNAQQFKGKGLDLRDYYCYEKPITAPADGIVADVLDGIPDNLIGDANTQQNWGNTVVIKLQDDLYAQLSHLKPGSIKIKKGDVVKKGDVLALCGNSGRSPYPHLHFQLQETPHIGSKTKAYPLSNYLVRKASGVELNTHAIPRLDEQVTAIQKHPILDAAFHLLPGRTMTFEVHDSGLAWLDGRHEWLVKTDEYNNSYLECSRTGATAWFYNNGEVHSFVNFMGTHKSLLYFFYVACYRVVLAYEPKLTLHDRLPANQMYSGIRLFLQDFIAPFHLFLKADYRMRYGHFSDDFLDPSAELISTVTLQKGSDRTFRLQLDQTGITHFYATYNHTKFTAICTND